MDILADFMLTLHAVSLKSGYSVHAMVVKKVCFKKRPLHF